MYGTVYSRGAPVASRGLYEVWQERYDFVSLENKIKEAAGNRSASGTLYDVIFIQS